MEKVTSKDGTQIAYDRQGQGPAVILIDGSFSYRSFSPMPGIAAQLAPQFTVYTYDRRGRGDSSDSKDTLSNPVEREVEDIDALIGKADGSACLYGMTIGAALALEAAIRLGDKVRKLALYGTPYKSGEDALLEWHDYRKQLAKQLAAGRRSDAVALFIRFRGSSAAQLEAMRQSPYWSKFESVAPTLAYDAADLGEDCSVPAARAASLTVPTLVLNGRATAPFMQETAHTIAKVAPTAQLLTVEGQNHDVSLEVLIPALLKFFSA